MGAKFLGVALFVLLLSACANKPQQSLSGIKPTEMNGPKGGSGIVVMGVSVRHPYQAGIFRLSRETIFFWIPYDRNNLKQINGAGIYYNLLCRDYDSTAQSCQKKFGIWEVPAGHYTIARAEAGVLDKKVPYNIARYQSVDITRKVINNTVFVEYSYAGDIDLRPNAPSFSVSEGEVVYVGDLIFDLNDGKTIEWFYDQDEAAARSFMDGSPIAARMVVSPWRRIDGAPARPAATGK